MFRERIKAVYSDLSPSFQRLADYLMDHQYEAAFMTATQLGKRLDVDTATVVRFAQRLDYQGYPELLDEIQAEVKEQLAYYFEPVTSSGDPVDLFRAAMRQDLTSLQQCDLTLDRQTIERVVEMIDGARKIVVIGEGLSAPLADLLARTLHLLHYDAAAHSADALTIAEELSTLSAQDLLIAVAISSVCYDVTSAVEVAHARGVQTMGLLGARSWAVSRSVDVALVCPHLGPAKVPSYTTFSAAISALFQVLFSKHRGDLLNAIVAFEDISRQLRDAHRELDLGSSFPNEPQETSKR